VGEYAVTFARSARKQLERLDSTWVNRVFPRIETLGRQPRPSGCAKPQGEKNLWRIRVGGYRIIYAIYDRQRVVDVVAVRHRSEAYR